MNRTKVFMSVFLALALTLTFFASIITHTVPATDIIDLGEEKTPYAFAVNSNTSRAYVVKQTVTGFEQMVITIVDLETKAAVGTIGPWPYTEVYDVAVDSSMNKVFIATSNSVKIVDGATNAVVASLPTPTGKPAFSIAANPQTHKAFASIQLGATGTVMVIDGAANTNPANIDIGSGTPCGIAVNAATNKVYVAQQHPGDAVKVIDGATNTVIKSITGLSNPWWVAVNPTTNKIYTPLESNLQVINGITDTLTTPITLPMLPREVAVNPSANLLYVSHIGTTDVSPGILTIDGATHAILATDPLPDQIAHPSNNVSWGIGVNVNTGAVYVASNAELLSLTTATRTHPHPMEERIDSAPPAISKISPASPLTIYTAKTSATQTFTASYTDDVRVSSATITLDNADVTDAWRVNTTQLSYNAQLSVGQHTIILTVSDAAGNVATRNWSINVTKDTTPPTISSVSPTSPLTIYTAGTNATRVFSASYSDAAGVASATTTLDGIDVTAAWRVGTSGFSYIAQLSVGQHVIVLTVTDSAGNVATQVWNINVIQDTEAPVISDYIDKQNIKNATDFIGATISDEGSGVHWDSLLVMCDKKSDIMGSIQMTGSGFVIYGSLLTEGDHTITVSVSDRAGNMVQVSWTVNVHIK